MRMTRRGFLKLAGATLAWSTIPSIFRAEAGKEPLEKIIWEELQTDPAFNPQYSDYLYFAEYAPPSKDLPAIYTVPLNPKGYFFTHPERKGFIPFYAQLFTILPPGYTGKEVRDPRFPIGRMRVPPVTKKYHVEEDVYFSLQPMPNPYTQWDGVFMRKGHYWGEDYYFITGRASLPTFTLRKEKGRLYVSFLSFYRGEMYYGFKGFQGDIGVYRNGTLDDELSNLLEKNYALPEGISIRPLVVRDPDKETDEMRIGDYPGYWAYATLHQITITIPLARRSEEITLTFTPEASDGFPEKKDDLREMKNRYTLLGSREPVIPLQLTFNPPLLRDPVRVTPRVKPYFLHPPYPEQVKEDGYFEESLKQLGLREVKGVEVYTITAYPIPWGVGGVRISAIASSPLEDEVWLYNQSHHSPAKKRK